MLVNLNKVKRQIKRSNYCENKTEHIVPMKWL